MIPLYAIGPAAERFAGLHEGPAIGRLLRGLVLDSTST
jgi:hypothetical protein